LIGGGGKGWDINNSKFKIQNSKLRKAQADVQKEEVYNFIG
jgi:hypothetical protein